MTIPAGFGEAHVRYQANASYPNGAEWTFGFETTAPGATPTARAATILGIIAGTSIEALMSDSTAIESCLVKLGPDDTGPSGIATQTIAGTVASDTTSPNVALLVQKRTDLGGRAGRGRMYVPGLPELHVGTGGIVSATQHGLWGVAMDAIFVGLVGADMPMFLLHDRPTVWTLVDGQPRRVPVPGSVAPAPTEVTGLAVAEKVATQRRRLRD
jgi:hypothetical protein